MSESYIEVQDLSYWYPESGVPALEAVSLSVQRGEFACIVGPSGCGKSTMLTILSGLSTPQQGRVSVAGEVLHEGGKRLTREMPRCGYMFQDSRLLPWRTVRQNIDLALKAEGVPSAEWDGIVERHLAMLRLDGHAESWPLNLSGGQRQRVAIARALAVDPAYMLMDEPFSTLDEVTARFLRRELLEIWRRTGKTILFVTHSIREAVYLADTIFLMTKGPGKVFGTRRIDVPRPRSYEDPKLTEIEGEVIAEVLERWGYYEEDEPLVEATVRGEDPPATARELGA